MEYILGVIVSLLVKYLKSKFGTDGFKTASILVVVSVLGAGVYVWLVSVGYWSVLAQILISAGAFHNFIVRPLSKKK